MIWHIFTDKLALKVLKHHNHTYVVEVAVHEIFNFVITRDITIHFYFITTSPSARNRRAARKGVSVLVSKYNFLNLFK